MHAYLEICYLKLSQFHERRWKAVPGTVARIPRTWHQRQAAPDEIGAAEADDYQLQRGEGRKTAATPNQHRQMSAMEPATFPAQYRVIR